MMIHIENWVVGFIIVFIFLRITRGSFKGLFAWLLLTIIPYVLGNIILKVIGYH